MSEVKEFLIVGFGSIGQRHARNLQTLKAGRISICDSEDKGFLKAKELFSESSYNDYAAALQSKHYDAVFICAPNHFHVPLAHQAAKRGANLFIEKPLSHSLEGIDELENVIQKKNLVAMVACNMRFHPGIAALKKLLDENAIGRVLFARVEFGYWLPDWRPQSDYRTSYSAHREMGGGIILDAIHELDYISWFMGDLTLKSAVAEKTSDLEIHTEDIAELILSTPANALVSVHLDYLQRSYHRSCQLIGESGVLAWNFKAHEVSSYDAAAKKWKIHALPAAYDLNQMYLDELDHFLNCLDRKEQPLQDLTHARKVLEIALEARKAFQPGAELIRKNAS